MSSCPSAKGTVNITTPAVGASGSIRWTFAGTLGPSQSAAVTFRIAVAPWNIFGRTSYASPSLVFAIPDHRGVPQGV